MPRTPIVRSAPSANDPNRKPLVNESPSGLRSEKENEEDLSQKSPEELIKLLNDSREEVQRTRKEIEAKSDAIRQADLARSSAEAQLLEAKEKSQRVQTTGTPALPDALIPEENYNGPSQAEIYLALVAGVMSQQNVIKSNDNDIEALARSLLGISEIFYFKALRRNSFVKPATQPAAQP